MGKESTDTQAGNMDKSQTHYTNESQTQKSTYSEKHENKKHIWIYQRLGKERVLIADVK